MKNVQEYQDHIDDELQRAKDIYKEHFQNREFNYNRFVYLFDKVEEEQVELSGMKSITYHNSL